MARVEDDPTTLPALLAILFALFTVTPSLIVASGGTPCGDARLVVDHVVG